MVYICILVVNVVMKNLKNLVAMTVIGTAFDLYGTGNDRGVCECTDAGCGK